MSMNNPFPPPPVHACVYDGCVLAIVMVCSHGCTTYRSCWFREHICDVLHADNHSDNHMSGSIYIISICEFIAIIGFLFEYR